MGLLAFVLRALFVLFVIRLGGLVLRAFFGGLARGLRGDGAARGPARPDAPFGEDDARSGRIEDLVRDPVCGVHTARSSAIEGRYRGLAAYFCSNECAAKAAGA